MASAPPPGPKKLSNATLGLRFMQKSKQMQQQRDEPAAPKIQNDAEWSVPGWRTQASSAASTSVTYEQSLLPFLYPAQQDLDDEPPVRNSGRRTFKNGKEVEKSKQADAADIEDGTDQSPAHSDSDNKLHEPTPRSTQRKGQPSLSGLSNRPRSAVSERMGDVNGEAAAEAAPPRAKPAQLPVPSGFLRPGGVDAPPPSSKKFGSVTAGLLNKKSKREADEGSHSPGPAKKKRKQDPASMDE